MLWCLMTGPSVVTGSLATAGMLEELNKTYDTRILVSANTYLPAQEKVLCRLVDYAYVEEDGAPQRLVGILFLILFFAFCLVWFSVVGHGDKQLSMIAVKRKPLKKKTERLL